MNKKKINYFKSADDFSVPYFEYVPDDKTKSAIVLIYEIFGTTKHIHSFAEKLAKKGYLVYVPDIFSRVELGVNLSYDKSGFEKGIYLRVNNHFSTCFRGTIRVYPTQNITFSITSF